MDKSIQKTTLYRYFDDAGRLLYVGITKNQFGRLEAHSKTQPWWTEVATANFVHLSTREIALESETFVIGTEFPKYNKAGPVLKEEGRAHMIELMSSSLDDEFHDGMSRRMSDTMTMINAFSKKPESHKLLFSFGESIPWDEDGSEMLVDCLRCQQIIDSQWFKKQFFIIHDEVCQESAR
jgi:hypothetical protein